MKTLLILFNYFCAKKVVIALFVVSMIKSSDSFFSSKSVEITGDVRFDHISVFYLFCIVP
jgi:hypothetical protein